MIEDIKGFVKKKKSSSIARIFCNTKMRFLEIIFKEKEFGYKETPNSLFTKKFKFSEFVSVNESISENDKKLCSWENGFEIKLVNCSKIFFCSSLKDLNKWILAFKKVEKINIQTQNSDNLCNGKIGKSNQGNQINNNNRSKSSNIVKEKKIEDVQKSLLIETAISKKSFDPIKKFPSKISIDDNLIFNSGNKTITSLNKFSLEKKESTINSENQSNQNLTTNFHGQKDSHILSSLRKEAQAYSISKLSKDISITENSKVKEIKEMEDLFNWNIIDEVKNIIPNEKLKKDYFIKENFLKRFSIKNTDISINVPINNIEKENIPVLMENLIYPDQDLNKNIENQIHFNEIKDFIDDEDYFKSLVNKLPANKNLKKSEVLTSIKLIPNKAKDQYQIKDSKNQDKFKVKFLNNASEFNYANNDNSLIEKNNLDYKYEKKKNEVITINHGKKNVKNQRTKEESSYLDKDTNKKSNISDNPNKEMKEEKEFKNNPNIKSLMIDFDDPKNKVLNSKIIVRNSIISQSPDQTKVIELEKEFNHKYNSETTLPNIETNSKIDENEHSIPNNQESLLNNDNEKVNESKPNDNEPNIDNENLDNDNLRQSLTQENPDKRITENETTDNKKLNLPSSEHHVNTGNTPSEEVLNEINLIKERNETLKDKNQIDNQLILNTVFESFMGDDNNFTDVKNEFPNGLDYSFHEENNSFLGHIKFNLKEDNKNKSLMKNNLMLSFECLSHVMQEEEIECYYQEYVNVTNSEKLK